MEKELLDAFLVLEKKLKSTKTHIDELNNETDILETKKTNLLKDIDNIEKEIEELKKKRSDLQFFLDAKTKEDEIKSEALKQAAKEIERRTELVAARERNADLREIRIKDRTTMYGIKDGNST